MGLDLGTWMAAIGYQILENIWKEPQQEVKVNAERGGGTAKIMASILKFYL